MSALKTYDHGVYLLGAYFDLHDNGRTKEFRTWHQSSDLTKEADLRNVRPIPFTPVLVDDAVKPVLWGSNKDGLLCQLGYFDENTVPETVAKKQTFLRHKAPLTVNELSESQSYSLTFPPLNVIGQLAEKHTSVKALNDSLKDIYSKKLLPEKPDLTQFTISKIKVSQLAEPYKNESDKPLTDEQNDYNDWYDKIIASEVTEIQGIITPVYHSLGVVFSSDLYVGAEVSLIQVKLKQDSSGEVEKVLATSFVTKEAPKKTQTQEEQEDLKKILPSAVFNFDPKLIDDGYFLLRTRFWVEEYLQKQQEFLGEEVKAKFPDSVKQGQLKFETHIEHEESRTVQDVYTYELHEKVTFKPVSGFGKLSMVCGDLISLEECLIYQYPTALPSYSDFMIQQGNPVALKGTGVASLGVASAVQKTAQSYAQGFATKGIGVFGDLSSQQIATSVAKNIWSKLTVEGVLPEPLTAGASFLFGLQSVKDARDAFTDAVKLTERVQRFNLTAPQTFGRMVRIGFANKTFMQNALKEMKENFQNQGASVSTRNLAASWFEGRAYTKLAKGLPIVDSIGSMYDFYQLVDKQGKLEKQSAKEQDNFDSAATDYLQKIVMVKAEADWAQQLLDATSILNNKGKEQIARIVSKNSQVIIHINFKFNSWELPNTGTTLRSDIDMVCERIAELLKAHPDYRIQIEGHAGRIGSNKANNLVAFNRADEIKNAIIIKVDDKTLSERIITLSRGNTQPMSADNAKVDMSETGDDSALAIDRRVEISLLPPLYSLALPPSRTGMIDLEKIRQAKQAFDLGLDNNQKEQVSAVFNSLMGVAMLTPIAPVAAGVLLIKEGASIADSGLSFLDSMLTEGAYKDFKAKYKNINELNQLGKIHIEVLQLYRGLQEDIVSKRYTDKNKIVEFLKAQKTSRELQKRFLLRALALNGLIELLARISLSSSSNSDYKKELTSDRVQDYIETYILNDNWEAPLSSYNTMAQNWLNQVRNDNVSKSLSGANYFYGQQVNEYSYHSEYSRTKHLAKRAKIQGKFTTGFPVQTSLYMDDKENGFVDFAKLFDNKAQDVKSDDIGFSRLLVLNDRDDDKSWIPYSEWKEEGKTNRITPFTRVKLQVVLTKDASEDAKKFFKATLSYGCDRGWLDVNGPQYQVLLSAKEVSDLTVCGASDNELISYYTQQLGDNYVADKEGTQTLTAVEFEPTYWFGEYEIPGLKPLFSGYSQWESFDSWKKDDKYKALSYFFKLNNNLLILDTSIEIPSSKGIEMKTIGSMGETLSEIKQMKNIASHMKYGIDDNNTYGLQCHSDGSVDTSTKPLYLFDGLGNQSAVINEADLLVESFVKANESSKGAGKKPYIEGHITPLAALNIGNKFEWFDKQKPINSQQFNWGKEQSASIYVALLADKDNREDYKSIGFNLDKITMQLKLSIEEQDSIIGKADSKGKGPSYFSSVFHVMDINYELENIEKYSKGNTYKDIDSNYVEFDAQTEEKQSFVNFASQVLERVKGAPQSMLHVGTRTRKVYIMKFDLDYISPTGKKVKGLRPFGPILDDDTGEIYSSELRLLGLYQEGIDKVESKYLSGSPLAITLPESKSFYEGNLPWTRVGNKLDKVNISAQTKWESLQKKGKEEQKKWLKGWIKDKTETRSAPSEQGIS
ncbi:OmpA family protein [Aliivibrio fischeri]|uniref:OmpA family protein n=1 Tax=Aliivibrio fischeri TaxID=668 RepID=A0A6N3Z097_ALIFS|nr:OmpA family protein [Aliivibrio fischeri]MUK45131.1 OmpA family protein [Aliivibrio fischeri]MUK80790.1 OmpA family protein [Aliivibrio fischeri]MUK84201.1 OmpA family protein [Aliivibrio fischeri]